MESPDSYKLIGLIVSHVNRPVPEWVISLVSAGTAEPVRRNWPSSLRWSTSKRIASHNFGASCHSSISLGVSPFRRRFGFNSDIEMFCSFFSGSSMYRTLAAICSAVVVLPHHLGPSIRTAPFPSSFLARISSAILFLYSFISITSNFNPFIYSIHNFRENTIPFGRLAEYYSGDWRKTVREIGETLFGKLAKSSAIYCSSKKN